MEIPKWKDGWQWKIQRSHKNEELKGLQEKSKTKARHLLILVIEFVLTIGLFSKISNRMRLFRPGFLCPYWYLGLDNSQITRTHPLCWTMFPSIFGLCLPDVRSKPLTLEAPSLWDDSSIDEDIFLGSCLCKPCSKNLRWQTWYCFVCLYNIHVNSTTEA